MLVFLIHVRDPQPAYAKAGQFDEALAAARDNPTRWAEEPSASSLRFRCRRFYKHSHRAVARPGPWDAPCWRRRSRRRGIDRLIDRDFEHSQNASEIANECLAGQLPPFSNQEVFTRPAWVSRMGFEPVR